MKDKIVEEVRKDLLERSKKGITKYKKTLDREDLSLRSWLNHQYEELLDAALYCKKSIKMIESGNLWLVYRKTNNNKLNGKKKSK